MIRLTVILVCLIIFFLPVNVCTAQTAITPVTIEVKPSEGTKPVALKLIVPQQWALSINKEGNFSFKHRKYPSKITFELVNIAANYVSEESKMAIINRSIAKGYESLQKSAQQLNGQHSKVCGTDNILDNPVEYALFTLKTGSEINYYKFLYPSSEDYVFIVYMYFRNEVPLKDIEELTDNIILAVKHVN